MNPAEGSDTTVRRPFWCKHGPARRTFRWCRRCGYVVALLVAYGLVHVNQIGLPGFVKGPLIAQLRDRGLELEFSRMRVRLGRGIVAENVNVSRAGELAGEQIYADHLQIKLDWARVLRLKPEIAAVTVWGGKLVIPLTDTNGVTGHFDVDQVEGRLRFLSRELWDLEELRGSCLGGTFQAAGTVTNAGLLRRRSEPRPPGSGVWRRLLLKLVREAGRAEFIEPPALALAFNADLADPLRSTAEVKLTTAGAATGYGAFENLSLTGELNLPPATNGNFVASFRLESARAMFRAGSLSNLKADVHFEQKPGESLPDRAEWRLEVASLRWGGHSAASVTVDGITQATNSPPTPSARWNPFSRAVTNVPVAAVGAPWFASSLAVSVSELEVTNVIARASGTARIEAVHSRNEWSRAGVRAASPGVVTRWGRSDGVDIAFDLTPAVVAVTADPADGPWKWLRPYSFSGAVAATNVIHPKLVVDRAAFRLEWTNGIARVGSLDAMLLGGRLAGEASLDVASRRAYARGDSTIDAMGVRPLLTDAGRRWMGQFGWPSNQPPHVLAELGVVLPAWTNRAPDWREEVLPTVTIAGSASGGRFTFRGIAGDRADGGFTYTNRVWRVPTMTAIRPEGAFTFSYEGDEVSKEYHFGIRSTVDPSIAAPLITDPKARRTFDEFRFGGVTAVEGDVWGRWKFPERTAVLASVAATNVLYRGEHLDMVSGRVSYTNRFLSVADAVLRDGTQHATVPGFAYDIGGGRISFTNALSTFAPWCVTRTIGPKVHRTMEAYDFAEPPTVKINGVIGVKGDPSRNDIRFDAESGGGFRWLKLRARGISASVRSVGSLLVVSNLDAGFYGGKMLGNLEFDLRPGNSNTFRINTELRDADLGALVADFSSKTNRLEGLLSGRVRIVDGETRNPETWNGNGNVRLRDGFLWGFPLLGVFSTVLDGITPGLGQTRFTEGTATFNIADGRIATRDLEMKSPSMKLGYVGTVGFDRRLDLVVQASMFHEVPLLGPVVSIALSPFEKLFEYRLTGTLDRPVTAPAHVPSFLLFPFRPLGTLRDLIPDEKRPPATPSTNSIPDSTPEKP